MDPSTMTASDLDNKDKEEDKMFCGGEGKEKMTMVKGGKVIEKTLQDINIIQALSQKEAKATASNMRSIWSSTQIPCFVCITLVLIKLSSL